MKKFYKTAEAGPAPGGYVIRLDGKPLRTPLKKLVLLTSNALTEAIAREWAEQGADIQPSSMPFTQLANTMVDKARGEDRAEMNEMLFEYGRSDLVCYFATHPADLVKKHQQHWMPLVAWLRDNYGIAFETVSGIQYHQQPPDALEKLKKLIEGFGDADFTVMQAASATTGSVVIALALLEGKILPDEAYQAACVDEIYQLETWGEDVLARKRLDIIRSELTSIARFRDLVRRSPAVSVHA